MFWLIWLLVGCQLVWTAVRAFQAPWVWNPYQAVTALFVICLAAGVAGLATLWQREGMTGMKARMTAFEAEFEKPGSATAWRWNLAFWIVAGVLVFAYFRMEPQ